MSQDNIKLNNFALSYSNFVQSNILTPIVQHLRSKEIDVPVEELMEVLSITPTRIPSQVGTISGLSYGNVAPSIVSSVPRRSRAQPEDDGTIRRCTRLVSRGINKGNPCNKVLKPDQEKYCPACLKKVTEDATAVPAPGKKRAAKAAAVVNQESVDVFSPVSARQLKVNEYDIERCLSLEEFHSLIICSKDPENPVVVGKLVNKKIVALTEADIKAAHEYGLSVSESGEY